MAVHSNYVGGLEQLYAIAAHDEVETFLQRNAFLVPLLFEAGQVIPRYFPDSRLYLEVVADPETNDHPQLVLTINPTCPPNEALLRHQQLKDTWWVPNLHRARRALLIVPEYR